MTIIFQNKRYKNDEIIKEIQTGNSVVDKWNKLHHDGKTQAIGRSNNGDRVDYKCNNAEKIKNALDDLLNL